MPSPEYVREYFRNDPTDDRHGTVTGYVNLRCRCDRCVPVGREYMRQAAKEKKERGRIPDDVHGTYNGYTNYGCRCDACIKARAEVSAGYRANRKKEVEATTIAQARERVVNRTTEAKVVGGEVHLHHEALAAQKQVANATKKPIGLDSEIPGVIVIVKADRGTVKLDLRKDANLTLLTQRELAHMWVDMQLAMRQLDREMWARGMNLTANFGKEEGK